MFLLKATAIAVLFIPNFVFAVDTSDTFDKLLTKYERRHSFHGNVLIKKDGEVVYSKSIGVSHVESNSPNNIDSKFMIASITKTFTSAAILKLASEDKLSVEDPVSKYISLTKTSKLSHNMWDQIKIKHLLNHTSGLIRDFKKASHLSRSDYNNLDDITSKALEDEKALIFPAGERFYYSNFGYVILAAIVDKVARGRFQDYILANFVHKAKTYKTGEFHRSKVLANMASGYYYDESQRLRKRCCDDSTSLRGAASMYSTVKDLSLWIRYLNSELLPHGKTYLQTMLENKVLMDIDKFYGYGIMNDTVHGANRIFHNGHEWGFMSSMSYYPEKNLEIIVLANRHGFIGYSGLNLAEGLSRDLAKALFESELSFTF